MKLSLKNRLTLQFFLIGVLPMAAMGGISFLLEKEAILETEYRALETIKVNKVRHIRDFFSDLDKQVRNFSETITIVDAARDLTLAYNQLADELPEFQTKSLARYYETTFASQYRKVNGEGRDTRLQLTARLDPRSQFLQTQYIAGNPHPLGSKHKLIEAGDTVYDKAHARYHKQFADLNDRSGFYDTFIVDAKSGHIVYSVFKEVDFATSLTTGPFADSSIGRVFKDAIAGGRSDRSYLSDFTPYTPSYDENSGFIASPIIDGDSVIAVAIHQISKERMLDLLSDDKKDGGRFEIIVFDSRKNLLTNSPHIDRYRNSEANVSLNFKLPQVDQALAGESGNTRATDYLGRDTLMAFDSFKIGAEQWGILILTKTADAFQPIITLGLWIFGIGLLSALGTSISGFFIGRSVARPIQAVSDKLASDSYDIKTASGELAGSGAKLSELAANQASAIEQTAASIEEISAMINNNVEKAEQSTALSLEVQKAAGTSNESMSSLIAAMEELIESNKKIQELVKVVAEIGEKTTVIDEIVFQTKLLSFNASVEAERAGEHGRGFSVVAQEVGNLAQMSGKAASEISSMVKNSVRQAQVITNDNETQVTRNNALVHKTAGHLRMISESSTKLFEQAQQIVDSSREQVEGINQVNEAMNQIDQATQENSITAEQTARASEYLSTRADTLAQATDVLKNLISTSESAELPAAPEANKRLKIMEDPKNQANRVKASSNVVKISKQPKTVSNSPQEEANFSPIKKVSGEWNESASPDDNWNSL